MVKFTSDKDLYIQFVTKITEVNLSTKILEVNLFAFAYRLFRRDFSPIYLHLFTDCFMKISLQYS